VIVQKGLPRLSGRPAEGPEDTRYGALGNWNSEHFEFAVYPRRTPQRIGGYHSFDQAADLGRSGGPASRTAMRFRQSRPEFAKAFPLPADDCLGLDVQQGTTPAGPQAAECDPKHSIKSRTERAAYVFSGMRPVAVSGQHSRGQPLDDRSGAIEQIE
jgi:hypothetical protein